MAALTRTAGSADPKFRAIGQELLTPLAQRSLIVVIGRKTDLLAELVGRAWLPIAEDHRAPGARVQTLQLLPEQMMLDLHRLFQRPVEMSERPLPQGFRPPLFE